MDVNEQNAMIDLVLKIRQALLKKDNKKNCHFYLFQSGYIQQLVFS